MVRKMTEWDGGKLKAVREGKGLTQSQLGERVGVDRVSVNRWEGDVREPNYTFTMRLADALDVHPNAFRADPQTAPEG